MIDQQHTGPDDPILHPQSPRPRNRSWARELAIGILVCCSSLLILFLFTKLAILSVSEPPFRMILEPAGDHAVVRFISPGPGLSSDQFPVSLPISERQEIVLDSERVLIPGGRVVFSDTTILPGRFTIQIGDMLFEIMSSRIVLNGENLEWKGEIQPLPQSPRDTENRDKRPQENRRAESRKNSDASKTADLNRTRVVRAATTVRVCGGVHPNFTSLALGTVLTLVAIWTGLCIIYYARFSASRQRPLLNIIMFWTAILFLQVAGTLGGALYLYAAISPSEPLQINRLLLFLIEEQQISPGWIFGIGIAPLLWTPYFIVMAIGMRHEVAYMPLVLIRGALQKSKAP